MRYGSICSGVGTCKMASEPFGWECAFFAEIDPFAGAVLAHHYPEVPNIGDFTKIGSEHGPVDVLVGGTPCQSFSVAGQRAGLDDPRGNLAIEFARLAQRVRATWIVWENVPGVLSSYSDESVSDDGLEQSSDFATFLGVLGECGYQCAWRVLDAQYFGVPQRRRRVFVVGYLGDWRPPAAVLFEPDSLSRDITPSREAREETAELAGDGALGRDDKVSVCVGTKTRHNATDETLIAHSLRADGFDASEDGTGRGTPLVPVLAPTLTGNGDAGSGCRDEHGLVPVAFEWQASPANSLKKGTTPAVAVSANQRGELRTRDAHGSLAASKSGKQFDGVLQEMAVRRLTPRECERLMGYPDDHTLIPYRGKPAVDGPRYRAIGNGWARPVVEWIFGRIAAYERPASHRPNRHDRTSDRDQGWRKPREVHRGFDIQTVHRYRVSARENGGF